MESIAHPSDIAPAVPPMDTTRAIRALDWAATLTENSELRVCLATAYTKIMASANPQASAHAFVEFFENALDEMRAAR